MEKRRTVKKSVGPALTLFLWLAGCKPNRTSSPINPTEVVGVRPLGKKGDPGYKEKIETFCMSDAIIPDDANLFVTECPNSGRKRVRKCIREDRGDGYKEEKCDNNAIQVNVVTVTPTPTSTSTKTPIPTETSTLTQTPTLTATPTETPIPTVTSTPTETPIPTATPKTNVPLDQLMEFFEPTSTPTPTQTVTPVPTITPTRVLTATPIFQPNSSESSLPNAFDSFQCLVPLAVVGVIIWLWFKKKKLKLPSFNTLEIILPETNIVFPNQNVESPTLETKQPLGKGLGPDFLQKIYPKLVNDLSPKNIEKKHRVEVYLQRLERMIKSLQLKEDEESSNERDRKIKLLRNRIYKKYVVFNPKNSSDDDSSTVFSQQESLNPWIDYLSSPECNRYPMWVKLWAFIGMTKLANYNVEKGLFHKRTKNTIADFPDLDREVFAKVMDDLIAFVNNKEVNCSDNKWLSLLNNGKFGRLYAHQYKESLKKKETLHKVTKGKWKCYRNGDHEKLVKSLGHKTGWCIASEQTAKECLEDGVMEIYYSNDENNNPTIPRIAIRVTKDSSYEIRGVALHQNIDYHIALTDILGKKLEIYEVGRTDILEKKLEGTRFFAEIYKKHVNKESLTIEELKFLYQIDSEIPFFGYEPDVNIKKILNIRCLKDDFATMHRCNSDQISITPEEAFTGKKIYHHGDLKIKKIFVKNCFFPKYVGGMCEVSRQMRNLPQNTILPLKIEGSFILDGITELPKNTKIPFVKGSISLMSLKRLNNNTKFQEKVEGYLSLDKLTVLQKGTKLPEYISGGLLLSGLKTWEKGVVITSQIEGLLNISSLEDVPENLKLPTTIGLLTVSSLNILEKWPLHTVTQSDFITVDNKSITKEQIVERLKKLT